LLDRVGYRPTGSKYYVSFNVATLIAIGRFLLDVFSGPGIADGIGYSVVLVLGLPYPERGYAFA